MTGRERAARRKAALAYPRSTAFRGAYMKGWRAGSLGEPVTACPYHAEGWRAWRLAWLAGWHVGRQR